MIDTTKKIHLVSYNRPDNIIPARILDTTIRGYYQIAIAVVSRSDSNSEALVLCNHQGYINNSDYRDYRVENVPEEEEKNDAKQVVSLLEQILSAVTKITTPSTTSITTAP